MTRNVWWLAAGLMALALTGVVRAEDDGCCADKCPKECPGKVVTKVADKCTCDGTKDKDTCSCDKCKCEKKSTAKCTCEGKDKEKCTCDECKCMKKVEKVLRLGKGGVLLMLWKVASDVQDVGCCETTAKHNEGGPAKGSEECCSNENCPLRAAKKAVEKFPYRMTMPMPGPLYPHPMQPPIFGGPFAMPVPPPAPPITVIAPPMPHMPVALPAPPIAPCTASIAMAPPRPAAMRFVAEEGQVKMEMQHGDSCVVSERLKMKIGDGCSVQVSAVDGQVEVRCDCMEAKADSVIKTGRGDRIILEGHVKFEYKKSEQIVNSSADRVVFDASTGHFEIETSR